MRPIALMLTLIVLPILTVAQPISPPIAPETAAQVVMLETWGRGLLYDLAWTADDTLAAASQLGVWLYTSTGSRLALPRPLEQQPPLLSPDGTRILARTRGAAIAIALLSGGPALTAIASTGTYERYALALTPDNRVLLAVSTEGSATVWDAVSGALLRAFTVEGSVAAAINPAGTIAAVSLTRQDPGSYEIYDVIQLYDVASGARIAELTAPDLEFTYILKFSPDGTRLAAGAADAVYLWDVERAALIARLPTPPFIDVPAGEQPIVLNDFVAWSPDGRRLAVASTDQTYLLNAARAAGMVSGIFVWDVESGERLPAPPPRPGFGGPLAWHPDGDRLAYAAYDGRLRVWSVSAGDDVRVLSDAHYGSAGDLLAFIPQTGQLVTGSYDRLLRLWQNGTLIAQSAPHTGLIRALVVSPDGTQIVSASRFDVVVDRGDSRVRLDFRAADPFALAFDAAGEQVFGASAINQTLLLWSARTDRAAAPDETQFDLPAPIRAALIDPERDRAIIALDDGSVQVYALAANKLETTFTLPAAATALRYHPADPGLLIAGLADGQLIAYRGSTGRIEAQIAEAHGNVITDLAFDPAGALLASASADRTIRLWPASLSDGARPLTTLSGHIDMVTGLAWSADGARLYSGSGDTTVRVWGLPPG
ncbi:MAG: WD40 repeat domain-containing protein [Candidatus Flexifilum sp.]